MSTQYERMDNELAAKDDQIAALRAEVARLRGSLEKIVALDASMSATNMFAAKAHTIASAALAKEEKP